MRTISHSLCLEARQANAVGHEQAARGWQRCTTWLGHFTRRTPPIRNSSHAHPGSHPVVPRACPPAVNAQQAALDTGNPAPAWWSPRHALSLLLAVVVTLLLGAAPPAWATAQTPTRTISGNLTQLNSPTGLAVLSDGSLAVANLGNGQVNVYGSTTSGDSPPDSKSSVGPLWGIAKLPNDGLAVGGFYSNSVKVYDKIGISWNLTREISGGNTGLSNVTGIAVLSNGSLAVTNLTGNSVTVYASVADGNAAPERTISGNLTGINGPVGIAELSDGSLAVTNNTGNSVTVYASDADGNVAPARTISGAGLDNPFGLAVLADGSLAVGNSSFVSVYAPNADGNVAPVRTITDTTSPQMNTVSGIAVLSDGSLAVSNYGSNSLKVYAPLPPGAPTDLTATPGDGQASIAFTAPYNNGASITNYQYSTDNGVIWTAFNPKTTTSPVTITGLTNGMTYQVKLRAVNSAGEGTASSAVSVTLESFVATTTSLTSSPNPSPVGASVTFTATVAAAPLGASVSRLSQGLIGTLGGGVPTGNVEFFDDSTSLGTSALNGGGQATLATSALTQGTHSITAVYAGDASYQTSRSTALSQVVNAVVPAISPASQTITGQLAMPFTTMAYTASGFSGAVSYTISPTNLPPGLSFQSTTGVLSGTPTQTQTNATFTVTATDGNSVTATATINITILATQATGTTPGGPVTATITGGNCLGFENGSAQFTVPTNPPAGQTFPYGVFGFTVLQCGQDSQDSQGSQGAQGGTVTITLRYPQPLPEGTRYWKYIDPDWVDWTSKVTITGNTVVLTITDDGDGDTNPNPGEISDPSGPAFDPTPIPTLSEWGLMLLMLSMLAVGWQRLKTTA